MDSLALVYYQNALNLIAGERRKARRIDQAYRMLVKNNTVHAKLEDWLSNPFVSTALKILKFFTGNSKIKQAIKLLEEAAAESKLAKAKR